MEASILAEALESWCLVFSWPYILYPIAGTLLSMVFSVIPGLSGVTLMALAIPFTFNWEPVPVLLIFGAFVGGATFMGSVTAILFNIPGRNASAATMLDGYPMAQQGKAKTAIGCSAAASALGSTFGIVVLILAIPFIRAAVLAFGPAEVLMIAIWGLTTLVVLARGHAVKSFAAAGMGLILSFIGYDPRTAELRYTFESLYLRDGLSLIPTFLGLFAMTEIMSLMMSPRSTISGKARIQDLSGELWEGVWSCFQHLGLFIRCSIIGTVVGMIPSIGATVASFMAYGHAKQSAGRDQTLFGRGNIRGVLAPEAANDAKDGGSLLPTLALGIPGSLGTAMLLVVLNLHGITPGKELLDENLRMAFILIWSMFFSNWLTSILGMLIVNPLVRLTTVRTHLLLPIIIALVTTGAYVFRGRFEDILVAYLFGLIGYGMKIFDWPRIPLLIAFVLGPLFENNFLITLKLHELGTINFWQRPIAMSLLVLTLASLALPYLPFNQGGAARKGSDV
jgi:TctA family transporter